MVRDIMGTSRGHPGDIPGTSQGQGFLIPSREDSTMVRDIMGTSRGHHGDIPATSQGQGFLIPSREDSTMILQTGQEILELDTSGFSTQGPTLFAGNLGQGQFIVQVSPLGLRLLQGVTQRHFVPWTW
ncbi:PREDICTED: cleavage and polyadenylation specificity factor subunit 1, partial [Corvus brachyrhynchos]|uniref:cleavage and polyadenylation specificity factor subunit 1 n=1 Tax=Corvus brachyrhynchos TaxID=85066 RepID=UPI0008167419